MESDLLLAYVFNPVADEYYEKGSLLDVTDNAALVKTKETRSTLT